LAEPPQNLPCQREGDRRSGGGIPFSAIFCKDFYRRKKVLCQGLSQNFVKLTSKEKLPMGMTEKIRILLVKKNVKAAHLAKMLGTSPSNLYKKFERDNFSEKELIKIAETLGCKYEGFFFLDNGDRV